jgi:hypothetical protein
LNLAHVHLLLNHVPTVGFGVGLGLLVLSVVGRSHDDLKRASLLVLLVAAILSIPTFFSGKAAETVVLASAANPAPHLLLSTIQRHEDAALIAFTLMEITGAFAWLALWQWRSRKRLPEWNLSVVFLLSIVTFGLMARAATIGGEINHSEIRAAVQTELPAGEPTEPAAVSGTARAIGSWVVDNSWVWPTAETLHFVGLSLLFAVVLLVDLRLLGVGTRIPVSAVSQLLPVGALGLSVNLITGTLFFLGRPEQYTGNVMFFWKIVLVVIAGVNDLYLMLCPEAWAAGPGGEAPLNAKIFAASGIALWLGVLFSGHMLPFLGNAF